MFYVLLYVVVPLSLAVVVVVVVRICFWRVDLTELKNSILQKNVLNTHARARTCTACVREFSSGAFIIARCIEGTRVRRVMIYKLIFFFR